MSSGFTLSSTDGYLHCGLFWSSSLNVKIPVTAISSYLTNVLTTWAILIALYCPTSGIIQVFRQKKLELCNTDYWGREIANDFENTILTSVQCKC